MALSNDELACVYAALILADDNVDIKGDKIATILKAANYEIEPYWPGLFAGALEGVKVSDLLKNVGSAPVASAAPVQAGETTAAAGKAAGGDKAAKKEEKKEEKEESGDEDMVRRKPMKSILKSFLFALSLGLRFIRLKFNQLLTHITSTCFSLFYHRMFLCVSIVYDLTNKKIHC